MRNTQENFPNVPVENLSDWAVVRKSDEATFDVTSQELAEGYTKVTFVEGEETKEVTFTPGVGEQLQNDEYAVVFKYGGEPVTDNDGVI